MHLLELFSIVIRKIDMCLTSIVVDQKPTNQIAQHMVENWRGFRTLFTSFEAKMVVGNIRTVFGLIFGEYSDIAENDIHTMLRFL